MNPSSGPRLQFGLPLALVCTVIAAACAQIPRSAPLQVPSLGPNASLHGKRPFPPDNPWNTPINREPVDPNSAALVRSIGVDLPLHPDFGTDPNGGIPYIVVPGYTKPVTIAFDYPNESDPGPYPVPPNTPIEGGPASKGDRHILVIDRDNWKLYELFSAFPRGNWIKAGSGAVFDLDTNKLRPAGWTSADAAGLPIFPGLVRYEEVERGSIRHALRFTVRKSRRAYVEPARHFASRLTDENLPPMGMRVRLKAGYDISRFPKSAQVILQCLKTYGMMVADNGGNWFVTGAPDPRWNETELNTLKDVRGKDFEVVKMGPLTTR